MKSIKGYRRSNFINALEDKGFKSYQEFAKECDKVQREYGNNHLLIFNPSVIKMYAEEGYDLSYTHTLIMTKVLNMDMSDMNKKSSLTARRIS